MIVLEKKPLTCLIQLSTHTKHVYTMNVINNSLHSLYTCVLRTCVRSIAHPCVFQAFVNLLINIKTCRGANHPMQCSIEVWSVHGNIMLICKLIIKNCLISCISIFPTGPILRINKYKYISCNCQYFLTGKRPNISGLRQQRQRHRRRIAAVSSII